MELRFGPATFEQYDGGWRVVLRDRAGQVEWEKMLTLRQLVKIHDTIGIVLRIQQATETWQRDE